MSTEEILDQFKSSICLCGRTKKKKQSFCWLCYLALPVQMQRNLYKRFMDGYEEAFEEAARFLGHKN